MVFQHVNMLYTAVHLKSYKRFSKFGLFTCNNWLCFVDGHCKCKSHRKLNISNDIPVVIIEKHGNSGSFRKGMPPTSIKNLKYA